MRRSERLAPSDSRPSATGGRPRFVTCLSLGVLILAAVYLTRFAASLSAPALPLSVPNPYLTVTGGVWGGAAAIVAFGLWTGRRWAPRWALAAAIAFTLWYWADRWLWVRSELVARTWPLAAAVTAFGLAAVGWGLRHPTIRRFFEESHG